MAKSADAFRTISEVAEWLGVQTHVLRFWESKFTQVKPVKRAGGRRYYRPSDMLLLGGIRKLLHDDGLTIKGVQKILREEGMAYVSDMSPPLDAETDAQLDADLVARMDEDVPLEPIEAEVLPFASPAAPAQDVSSDDDTVPEPGPSDPVDAPLPSFLRTPTPSPDDPLPDLDTDTGLPFAPLVEDVPVPTPDHMEEDVAGAAHANEPTPVEADADITPDPQDAPPPLFKHDETPSEAVDMHTPEAPEPVDPPDAHETPKPVRDVPAFLTDRVKRAQDTPVVPEPSVPVSEPAPEAADEPEPAPVQLKPRVIDVPDDPAPDAMEVAPSALSKAARLTHLTDAQRNMVRPLLAQLTALRDQMASSRRDPR